MDLVQFHVLDQVQHLCLWKACSPFSLDLVHEVKLDLVQQGRVLPTWAAGILKGQLACQTEPTDSARLGPLIIPLKKQRRV